MTRRFVAVCCALALIGCCGGGRPPVRAGVYADRVCSATADWLRKVQLRAGTVADAVSPATTPAEGREVLRRYVDAVVSETRTVVAAVRDAGEPDVADGAAIAEHLVGALEAARGALEAAEKEVASLPTSSRTAFTAAAQALALRIGTRVGEVAVALHRLSSTALDRAFEASRPCRSITATGASG
ncbi:MAG: hypothetical protein ABR600_08935 [Actinomycetota bacterium]